MYVDEKILNQFSSIREVFKDVPIRRLISEDDRIDLIKRAKTEFIDCIEREKVLDDKNIITVQTKEYGSVEVIPVDTITDIELANVQPVKQGRWICEFYNDVFDVYQADCSVCKKESTDKYDKVSESFEYCPHCGAKMNSDTNG